MMLTSSVTVAIQKPSGLSPHVATEVKDQLAKPAFELSFGLALSRGTRVPEIFKFLFILKLCISQRGQQQMVPCGESSQIWSAPLQEYFKLTISSTCSIYLTTQLLLLNGIFTDFPEAIILSSSFDLKSNVMGQCHPTVHRNKTKVESGEHKLEAVYKTCDLFLYLTSPTQRTHPIYNIIIRIYK